MGSHTAEPAADEARYDAIRSRDASADGTFFYAVSTTGVYCRPSCAARLAKREHVTFFASADAAERAGYRACKRCRPQGENDRERMRRVIERARTRIDGASEIPKLDELANEAELSPYHFHREFVRVVGMTPRRYAIARRAERLGATVREAPRVTDAACDAGFGSSSGFYESSRRTLGMTPTAYRKRGTGETIRIATAATSLGALVVAATERGVCAVRFGTDPLALRAEIAAEFDGATLAEPDSEFAAWLDAVIARIEGAHGARDIPLDVRGTIFQRRVWSALTAIPSGERISYAEVARRIDAPTSVRAVASAVGANPVAVIVPCHRVVGSDGTMRGYRWGIERKRALLENERR